MDLDNERIIRLPEVLSLVGVSRSTLYAWMAKGRFLAGVQVGPRTRAWRARGRSPLAGEPAPRRQPTGVRLGGGRAYPPASKSPEGGIPRGSAMVKRP